MLFIFVVLFVVVLFCFLIIKEEFRAIGLVGIQGPPQPCPHPTPGVNAGGKGRAGCTAMFHDLERKGEEEEDRKKQKFCFQICCYVLALNQRVLWHSLQV